MIKYLMISLMIISGSVLKSSDLSCGAEKKKDAEKKITTIIVIDYKLSSDGTFYNKHLQMESSTIKELVKSLNETDPEFYEEIIDGHFQIFCAGSKGKFDEIVDADSPMSSPEVISIRRRK